MATLVGWLGTLIGALVAAVGILMVLRYSPLFGTISSIELVYLWAIVFLVGVLLMGWGLAKMAST